MGATAPKTKTTLLGAITAATAVKTVKKTVKKAGITLKSTLSKLHLHDERDQQDTIKAEEKKEHGEKLSWHEKALLKQQKDAKAQTLTKSKVQKHQQQKEQKEQPKKASVQRTQQAGRRTTPKIKWSATRRSKRLMSSKHRQLKKNTGTALVARLGTISSWLLQFSSLVGSLLCLPCRLTLASG